MLHQHIFKQNEDNTCDCEHTLNQPHFHHDGSFFHAFVFEEMMKWRHCKELSLEDFFPENLQSARTKLENKNRKHNHKRNHNSKSHIEQIDERGEDSS